MNVVKETIVFSTFLCKLLTGRLKVAQKETYIIMEPVKGVTFENRQNVIRDLKVNALCSLKHSPTNEFPNRIEVWIGKEMVGYLPDSSTVSIAKMLLDKVKQGKRVEVVRWTRVGGTSYLKYGLRVEIRIDK